MEKRIKSKKEELELMYDCVNLYIDITTPQDWEEEKDIVGYDYDTRILKMKELRTKIYQELVKGE